MPSLIGSPDMVCFFIILLIFNATSPVGAAPASNLYDRFGRRGGTAPDPGQSASYSLFQGQAQVDAVTVLMLLGEATIWKTIWGRFRSRRSYWRQWAFAISPGWTPLAASLFAAMNGSIGPPNLVFDRPPEGSLSPGLVLTNLNSGATHSAQNTVLQNIWHTWCRGPRKQKKEGSDTDPPPFDVTREVGVVDVNLNTLQLGDPKSEWLHIGCLIGQLVASIVLGLTGYSFETFVVLLVALAGQAMLLISVTPRAQAWHRVTRGHRAHAVMLHHGFDTQGALFIRKATLGGKEISLEEYCWDAQAQRSVIDNIKLTAAGVSFLIFVAQIILVGWMSSQSRIFYLILGGLGLLANTIEAASQPKWMRTFRSSFTGNPRCSPLKGSLMSAIAILLAGQFPAARESARLLYPDNARFKESLHDLKTVLDDLLCTDCRNAIRCAQSSAQKYDCARKRDNGATRKEEDSAISSCAFVLASAVESLKSKQTRDGVATVSHFLSSLAGNGPSSPIETSKEVTGQQIHVWKPCEVV